MNVGAPREGLAPWAREANGVRGLWVAVFLFLVVGALLTEAVPIALGTGAEAKVDWGFAYVTMKFVVLPGASLVALGGLLVQGVWQRRVPWPAVAAGAAALLYLVTLVLWPAFWFVPFPTMDAN